MEANSGQVKKRRSVFGSCAKVCRRLVTLVAFFAALFLAVWFFAQHRVHEEIRLRVESLLNDHYQQFDLAAQVGSARLLEGRGIEIHDVVITNRRLEAPRNEVVRVDKVLLACDAEITDLLQGPPTVDHVVIRGLHLQATRESTGEWDALRLLPLPESGGEAQSPPPLSIESATFAVHDDPRFPTQSLRFRDIRLTVAPKHHGGLEAPASTGPTVGVAQPAWSYVVQGTAATEHAGEISVTGSFAKDGSSFSLQGEITDLHISPRLQICLPRELATSCAPLSPLQADAQLKYWCAKGPETNHELRFDVKGKLLRGRIDDPRLPYPLTELTADVHLNNKGLAVTNMRANSGLGNLHIAARRDGFDAQSPFVLHAKAERLSLDRRLAESFPEAMRDLWDKYDPSGTINVDMTLTHNGQDWQPDIKVECLDVTFSHYKFPYRMFGCIGTVHWQGTRCDVDLRALASGRVVSLVGTFQDPGPDYTGELRISLDGPIPLDEKLLAATPEKSQPLLRSFEPRGMITVAATLRRTHPTARKLDQHIVIQLHDCAVRYEKFPYPLDGISGTVEITNGDWKFSNLHGYNDGGEVTGNGTWTQSGPESGALKMRLIGHDIELEEELRQALGPNARKLWSDLRPRGSIDQVVLDIGYETSRREVDLSVKAEKWPREAQGQMISIQPRWLPYQMDNVTGTLSYEDGLLRLEKVAANHGVTTVALDGDCVISPVGWNLTLRKLTADRVRFDAALLDALPKDLGRQLGKLNLTGNLSLEGAATLGAHSQGPLQANWDVTFDIDDGDIDCGLLVTDIFGSVRFTGRHDVDGFRTRGFLNLDSLICKDMQLTRIEGPLWLDSTRLIYGTWAHPNDAKEPPQRVRANVFGGILESDGQVLFTAPQPFHVQAWLRQASLAQFAKEKAPRMRNLQGQAYAAVRLMGNSQGTHSWRGNGNCQLRDAEIYDVPVLLALLKLLSIRQPDTTAFNSSDMRFRIHGDHLYFDQMSFTGDAISLRGNGWMNLDGEINLSFGTRLGRDEIHVPVITPVLGMASRQFLLIEMDGTLENPNPPTKKVFPALNDTLRQLFPELAQPESRASRPRPAPQ